MVDRSRIEPERLRKPGHGFESSPWEPILPSKPRGIGGQPGPKVAVKLSQRGCDSSQLASSLTKFSAKPYSPSPVTKPRL